METTREDTLVTERGASMQSTTAAKADQTAMAAGERLQATADLIREKAPAEGRMGTAATAVAQTFEEAGAYLQQQGLSGAIEDVETLIRRYPVQSLLVGLGVGYLLARMNGRQ